MPRQLAHRRTLAGLDARDVEVIRLRAGRVTMAVQLLLQAAFDAREQGRVRRRTDDLVDGVEIDIVEARDQHAFIADRARLERHVVVRYHSSSMNTMNTHASTFAAANASSEVWTTSRGSLCDENTSQVPGRTRLPPL